MTSGEWYRYLESLPGSHKAVATQFWNLLREAIPSLVPPRAGITDDGRFWMSWSRGEKHLEMELDSKSGYDFFYWDRSTDEDNEGVGIHLFAPLPSALRRALPLFSRPQSVEDLSSAFRAYNWSSSSAQDWIRLDRRSGITAGLRTVIDGAPTGRAGWGFVPVGV